MQLMTSNSGEGKLYYAPPFLSDDPDNSIPTSVYPLNFQRIIITVFLVVSISVVVIEQEQH